MPDLIPYLIIPLALIVWALAIEIDIWCLYAYATFREGRFQRISFWVVTGISLLLAASTLVGPIIALFTHGLWAANAIGIGWSIAVSGWIYLAGRLMEWQPNLFYNTNKDRRALREIPKNKREMFTKTIANWPEMSTHDHERFLRGYLGMALHFREAFFTMLLDDFPIVTPGLAVNESLPRFNSITMRNWAGAHLFAHVDVLLAMRHTVSEDGAFRGSLPGDHPPKRDFPEAEGDLIFAREEEDVFVIGARRG